MEFAMQANDKQTVEQPETVAPEKYIAGRKKEYFTKVELQRTGKICRVS